MYSRSRFDALTDGVFSVAMTLLVIDVRLPDALSAGDEAGFVRALRDLEPKLLAYAMSFFVVGVSWLAKVVARTRSETVGRLEALLTLVYLFLVTLTPFSTMALSAGSLRAGPDVLAAVWIYCANLGLMGLTAALILLARRPDAPDGTPWAIVSPLLLFVSGLAGAGAATLGSNQWAYTFLITILGGFAERRAKKAAKDEPSTPASAS